MIDKLCTYLNRVLHFVLYIVFRFNLSEKAFEGIVQFVKFGIVGVINNLIYYIVYLVLIKMGMYYVPANIIGFTVSVFNAYYWNSRYVFLEDRRRAWWKTFIKTYFAYAGTGIVLSNILLVLWVEVLGISKTVAPLISLIITVPLNYVINKFWAYKE